MYHYYVDENGHTYDVYKLWGLTKDLPIIKKTIKDLTQNFYEFEWKAPIMDMPVYIILNSLEDYPEHFDKVQNADLTYPILISETGIIYDGLHRTAKCFYLALEDIDCKIVPLEILQQCKLSNTRNLVRNVKSSSF